MDVPRTVHIVHLTLFKRKGQHKLLLGLRYYHSFIIILKREILFPFYYDHLKSYHELLTLNMIQYWKLKLYVVEFLLFGLIVRTNFLIDR